MASPRILIIRLSALGDTALTIPLYYALRQSLPDAHIGWLTGELAAPIVENLPGLNKLHILKNSEKNIGGIYNFSKRIRNEKYDIAIDAQGLTKSAMIAWLAKIPKRIGFKRAPLDARELAPLLNNKLISPPADMTNVSQRMSYLATALDINNTQVEFPELPVDQNALDRMITWANNDNLCGKMVVFGIGAGWPTKIWNPEEMAVCVKAARVKGYRPVILWGPPEKPELEKWQKLFGDSAHMAPPTDVREMIALLSLCEKFAGPDSASLHMAWLLGKPTFSWWGASDPARCAPPEFNNTDKANKKHTGMLCPPHNWNRKEPTPTGLQTLLGKDALEPFVEWLRK